MALLTLMSLWPGTPSWSANCGPDSQSIGQTPLTEFDPGQTYAYHFGPDGQAVRHLKGGLYFNGRNDPPRRLKEAATGAASRVKPLNAAGEPDPAGGLIGLLTLGMSNANQESGTFIELVARDPDVNPAIVVVNGAQGGKDATQWIDRNYPPGNDTYAIVRDRLQAKGITPEQVQIVWMKHAVAAPAVYPNHVGWLKRYLNEVQQILRTDFPNLRLIYVSSRIYAGYASTSLNPEPYAYESAFAVRDFLRDQHINEWHLFGSNYRPWRPHDPVALWGPYLWADGLVPRDDGLTWECTDFNNDGTHPSGNGQRKVAQLLIDFFKTDPTSRGWFLALPQQ
jgi:hypothetical protein